NLWKQSPRYAQTWCLDPKLPSDSFLKIAGPYPKHFSSLLIQLHTAHLPLNKHLHQITMSDTPHCPICPGIEESIHHFLFDCPQYVRERHTLHTMLGHNVLSLSYMLSQKEDYLNLPVYSNLPSVRYHLLL
ncbi:hypothetical protein BJ138DRAFT_1020376, partial [Hygrophoropsis aurantiaca]